MGKFNAWKTKAAAWLKRVLIITGIVILSALILFLGWKAYVGARKKAIQDQIAKLEAELSVQQTTTASLPSPLEQALIARLGQLVK